MFSLTLRTFLFFNLILMLVLATCTSVQRPIANPDEDKDNKVKTNEEVVDLTDGFTYEANINRQTTIQGIAQNAKLGAVVMTSDYTPVYLDGVIEWESGILGKSIEVTGILRLSSLAPNSVVNSEGEISHGIDDDSYVLENPTWIIND